jgi:hypothetical protein
MVTPAKLANSRALPKARLFGNYGSAAVTRGIPMNVLMALSEVAIWTGDLIRWTEALHAGKVLSPASFVEMVTPLCSMAAATTWKSMGRVRRSTSATMAH